MKSIALSILFKVVFAFILHPMSNLHAEVYEGWLDADSTGPIIPLWLEMHEDGKGKFAGWYVNRIDPDTIVFTGERMKSGLVLTVKGARNVVKEQFTLQPSSYGYSGYWKPAKGYGADLHLFLSDEQYAKTMHVSIDPKILRKGKSQQDSISDLQYLMVRKGIASIKVYRERNDGHRPWISYHVIDVMKNKEIQLTDYLIDHVFAKTKIQADDHAEGEALNQLKQFSEEEIASMEQCGMNLDQDLHLDNIVLYPNRTSVTFDYLNVFGMHEDCEHYMYPVQFTLPIETFAPCIRPGSFLTRLLP